MDGLSIAFSVLAVALGLLALVSASRTLPARALGRAEQASESAQAALQACQRIEAQDAARTLTMERMATEVENLCEQVETKRRRVAASASKIQAAEEPQADMTDRDTLRRLARSQGSY